eukprot:2265015-Rhodomonas_salina.2
MKHSRFGGGVPNLRGLPLSSRCEASAHADGACVQSVRWSVRTGTRPRRACSYAASHANSAWIRGGCVQRVRTTLRVGAVPKWRRSVCRQYGVLCIPYHDTPAADHLVQKRDTPHPAAPYHRQYLFSGSAIRCVSTTTLSQYRTQYRSVPARRTIALRTWPCMRCSAFSHASHSGPTRAISVPGFAYASRREIAAHPCSV